MLGPVMSRSCWRALEAQIVGNEAFAFLAEEFFDDRMAAGDDEKFAGVVEFGADVAAVGS